MNGCCRKLIYLGWFAIRRGWFLRTVFLVGDLRSREEGFVGIGFEFLMLLFIFE